MSKASYSWKALTDEKKKEFKDRVIEMKKLAPEQTTDKVTGEESLSHSKANVFPLSRVKKIVTLNEEIKTLPVECVVALEKAAQLFLQDFASTSFSVAQKHGRKTVKTSDIM